jgi:type I restriction-modification system DNA methylase subunit
MLAASDDDSLHDNLNTIFQNKPFKEIGFNNLIEPTFFAWFIEEKESGLYDQIRKIAKLVADYSTSSLKVHDIHESDILKELYQSLSPRELRHSLGEFYTPDWLAEHTLKRLEYSPVVGTKTIDPTCGSGTFIIAAINAYKMTNFHLKPGKLAECILNDIKGIDLNPLAVAASKINYLIALGEDNLVALEGNDIEIPIYLSDSMLAPLEHKYETSNTYIIPTKVANFSLKKSFVEGDGFLESMTILEEAIKNNEDYTSFKGRIAGALKWDNNKIDDVLEDTFAILKELEQKGLNGIWAGIIKNFFSPTFMGLFDYIIGNPPWVNWENLPESYRNSIKKYWSEYAYNLFRIKGMQARLGSAHDDICVLLTYIVADNFLKFGGKVGFVLPQTLFKSKGGGDGFRRFEIEDNYFFNVISVDDMVSLQPFDASNKTSVFVAKKSKTPNEYPVKYYKWNKQKGYSLDSRHTLEIVSANVDIEEQVAIPIDKDKLSSPWLSGELSVVNKLYNLVGKSHYKARKGVDTSLNQVFWVKELQSKDDLIQVQNCQSSGRSSVRQRSAWVERDVLYPVLRGGNFNRWRYQISLYQILLYNETTGKPLSKDEAARKYPKAFKYFATSDYIPLLEKRAIYQKHLSQYPNYSCFDIGPYSFSDYKVVWKALAIGMQACVISSHENKTIVPDHNVMLIPADDEQEAHYVCGILNSDLATLFVTSYIEWFFSTHILEYLNIPKYNSKNTEHKNISKLSMNAHNENDEDKIKTIEQKLNGSVNELFGFK